jgi:hypothetical protein
MDLIEEWHIEIFRPDSEMPEIAPTTLPTWRTARRYIEAAGRSTPMRLIQVTVPQSAPEAVLTELTAMGLRTLVNEDD